MPRVTITVPEKTPQPYRFQLDRQSVTLGRGSENDIPIDCGSVSVRHAEMRRVKGGYELRDTGSTNGVKLDGERREVIPLCNGLSVKLGDVAFDFALTEEERETLAREVPGGESPARSVTEGSPMELPPLKPPQEEPRQVGRTTEESGKGNGGRTGMILWFAVLATAAFAAGLVIRHEKETGESFIEVLKARISASAPAKGAPAVPEPQE